MRRETEVELLEEVLGLKDAKSAFLDETVGEKTAKAYTSEDRFKAERAAIFARLPLALAHVSEMPNAGDFVTRSAAGKSILLTRDKSGGVHAFLNACRHRGSRLVSDASGCKHRFSCPYHAWTYASSGDLLAAPHFDQGFPGLDKADLGLTRLHCFERFGLIWVVPTPGETVDETTWFGGLDEELAVLGLDQMEIKAEETLDLNVNWKILVEGGIESYHFKIAHRATIGPFFEDNLSTYRMFGPHMRSVLPRTTVGDIRETDKDSWRLRDHANVLYTLFPGSQFLVQQDHLIWISNNPSAAGKSTLRLATMAPKSSDKSQSYWDKNHAITMTTLIEDFDLGEGIQANLETGTAPNLYFGRFEGPWVHLTKWLRGF